MRGRKKVFGALIAVTCVYGGMCVAAEPVRIPLWEHGAPGSPATKPEDEPTLYLYQPAGGATTKTAVIVCPGGGYSHLAIDHEGWQIAEWLNSFGVTALVLQYRHGGTGHRHPTPMLDGQRAVRTVRARAAEWQIDPAKIGVLGFSAGGHLASTLGTHFDAGNPDTGDPIYHASSRPDFMILCYPVITLDEKFAHRGSRESLLGKEPDEALVHSMSNELQVTPETPPTFLWHTNADTTVPAENSVMFYLALRRAGVPAELHVYQDGHHGLGLAKDIPAVSTWPDRCREWMKVRGLLEP